MTTNTTYKSASKGDILVSNMVTPHLANALAKVRNELTEATVADRSSKEALLAVLEAEYATRDDIETATTA